MGSLWKLEEYIKTVILNPIFTLMLLEQMRGRQWPSELVGLAPNHSLSILWGFDFQFVMRRVSLNMTLTVEQDVKP